MTLSLPALPFAHDALEPFMSARTLEVHHGKHHRAYVDTTNKIIAGTPLASSPLPEIVRSARSQGNAALFNASAQAWNHAFFWQCLTPSATKPEGRLADWLTRDFGSLDAFKSAFKAEAVGHFASGWAWLVLRGGKLAVTSYHDADTPLVHAGVAPLLVADVWEHAYYLDHQNVRAAYVDAFLDRLANWATASARLEAAMGGGHD